MSSRAREEIWRGVELAGGVVAFLYFSHLTRHIPGAIGDVIQYLGSLILAVVVVRLVEIVFDPPTVEVIWFGGRSDVPLAGPHFDGMVAAGRPSVFLRARVSHGKPGVVLRAIRKRWAQIPVALRVTLERPFDCEVIVDQVVGAPANAIGGSGLEVNIGPLTNTGDLGRVRLELRATDPQAEITVPVTAVLFGIDGRRIRRIRVRSSLREVRLHPE